MKAMTHRVAVSISQTEQEKEIYVLFYLLTYEPPQRLV